MNICLNNFYCPTITLSKEDKQFCLTTLRVINASKLLFPLFLPPIAIQAIDIAGKGYNLKNKVDILSKQYFCSNTKNMQVMHGKRLGNKKKLLKIRPNLPFRKKKRLPSKKISIGTHARDISLAGVALHTAIYQTLIGKVIGKFETISKNLIDIYTLYPTGKYEALTEKVFLLSTNIFLLLIVIGGYQEMMLITSFLRLFTALIKMHIETNNQEYLAMYTQMLAIGISSFQINEFYKNFIKKNITEAVI